MSAGADTKANTLELVRVPSSLLQRFQRGVALEALRESGSSFRAEAVARETASMGAGSGAEGYQWALTRKRTPLGGDAPERGHGAPLEPLAQLGDAQGRVGALDIAFIFFIDAAEPVAIQAAKGEGGSVNGR